jgi:hypothetical protein
MRRNLTIVCDAPRLLEVMEEVGAGVFEHRQDLPVIEIVDGREVPLT